MMTILLFDINLKGCGSGTCQTAQERNSLGWVNHTDTLALLCLCNFGE
jgi:hypothetical protein